MSRNFYHVRRLRNCDKTAVTNQDVHDFCQNLRKAIEATSLDGKTEADIFGEIYTRLRTNMWYTMRDDSYIKKLFLTNMKTTARNMPDSIKAVVNYVMEQVLHDSLPSDPYEDMQLSIAAMSILTSKMSDAAGLSEALNKQLMEVSKEMYMEEVNV